MSSPTLGRWTGVLAVSAMAVAGLGATTVGAAHASVSPNATPVDDVSTAVTVFLKAPHPAELAHLASTPVTNRAARLAQLAKVVPSDSARSTVVSTLTAAGFSLDHETTWSVTAFAPASVVTSVFGTRAADSTGLLSTIPADLAGIVSAAYPTTGGPAAFQPDVTSTLVGADFRNADTPADVKPSGGTKDAQNTVATLQLADFTPSDLTHYASTHHLADPVASGAYQTVKVDGGPSVMDDAGEGSLEVDLDQESILSTAPSAHQHAYFAPNTDAGFNDVFANVYDDVTGDKMATAPDPHLSALSSSWGECEGMYGAANIDTLEPLIESVVAAGVTVFASAGDDGIYDCRSATMTGLDNSQADVDFPSSSPFVVSTGGSNLSAPTSAPNTGTNWVEKVWSCATTSACENGQTGTGGGGGGASGSADGATYVTTGLPVTADFAGFPMPLYQQKTLTGIYAATKNKTRLLPDISADADPATGFGVYSTVNTGVAGTTLTVGGTSLASPISAAQLVNTLGDAGRHFGVGDIHAALYSASVRTAKLPVTSAKKPLRDVTVGEIGATTDRGSDPSVSAGTGYDTASGVGGVLWKGMDPFLFDTAAPKPHGFSFVRHPHHHTKKAKVAFRWTTRQGKDTLVLNTNSVVVTEKGVKTPLFTTSAIHGLKVMSLTRGKTYVLTMHATDIGGHRSKAFTTSITVPKLSAKHHH